LKRRIYMVGVGKEHATGWPTALYSFFSTTNALAKHRGSDPPEEAPLGRIKILARLLAGRPLEVFWGEKAMSGPLLSSSTLLSASWPVRPRTTTRNSRMCLLRRSFLRFCRTISRFRGKKKPKRRKKNVFASTFSREALLAEVEKI
jgi:hypothetical protein